MKTRDRALVTAVVASFAFALALRVWNLGAGLPYEHDARELRALDAAVRLVDGVESDPGWADWPSGLVYLAAGPVVAGHALAGVPLTLERDGAPRAVLASEHVDYLLGGRWLVALLGALTAALVAMGTRRFAAGAISPLLAGYALAVTPAHLHASQQLAPEVPAAFGAALAWLAALVIARSQLTWRLVIAAGLAVGLAASFAFAGGLAGLSVAAAILLDWRWSWRRRLAAVAVMGLVAIGLLGLISPWSLLAAGSTWDALRESLAPEEAPRALARWLAADVIGPVVLGVAALGTLAAVAPRLRDVQGRALAVIAPGVLALVALLALRGPEEAPRIAVVAAPGLALLVGVTAASLARLARFPVLSQAAAALIGLALVPVALAAGGVAWARGLPRTEVAALEWLVAHVPPGARLVIDPHGPRPDSGRFALQGAVDADTDFIVVTSQTLERARGDLGAARFVERVRQARPSAAFCPEPGQLAGPEVWVYPRSDRARSLIAAPTFVGECAF